MIGRSADQYKDGAFTWFTGIVKDINDPKNLNRVKVQALGFYDDSIAVDDLPWATVMMPVTSASLKGVGGNHHLEVGSWVVGFFRDGPSAQDPMVMGSIATQTSGTPDIPKRSYPNPSIAAKAKALLLEGPIPSVNNKVYESKAGHLIEVDNTDGKERIKITHGKTNSFIEFTSSGKIRIV